MPAPSAALVFKSKPRAWGPNMTRTTVQHVVCRRNKVGGGVWSVHQAWAVSVKICYICICLIHGVSLFCLTEVVAWMYVVFNNPLYGGRSQSVCL